MFEQFNEKYVVLSNNIIQLNEQRSDLLFKIKSAQLEYKRLLGLGDIKPVIDANEDDNEDQQTQDIKSSDKRGRKKHKLVKQKM